ncbi:MAG: SH3 domain-containing protein [Lachnospiraceae bacterium]|nr:SH3 domain-containing protein [Lachnospiraceae bacterium]
MIKKRLVTILLALSLASAMFISGCEDEVSDVTETEVVETVEETVDETTEETDTVDEDENGSADNADETIDDTAKEDVDNSEANKEETKEDGTEKKEEEAFHVESADILMFVKKAVNVRTGPNTNYERIGSLEKGTDVEVTGVADTGWYRIKYNGQVGYVSNKFLITEEEYKVLETAENAAKEAAKEATKLVEQGNLEISSTDAQKMAQDIISQETNLTPEQQQQIIDDIAAKIEQSVKEAAAQAQQQQEQQTQAASTGIDTGRVVALCNEYRANAGLGGLTEDATLDAMAAQRAQEIAQSFSHTRPDGRDCSSIYDDYGYSWMACGENIAAGQTSADEVMTSWMNSEGHKANILSGNFNRIGVACYSDPNSAYGYYWVQVFSD